MLKSTITLTYGDVCESHAGMQKIGKLAAEGLSHERLKSIHKKYADSELIRLHRNDNHDRAYLLIIRDGVNKLMDGGLDELIEEQKKLEPDTKAYMRGRVVNKHARHNLCFSEKHQEADFENGKGTIIAFDEVYYTTKLKHKLEKLFKVNDLQIEGNYYYDIDKCYIGYHGDSERRIVIGVRLGETFGLQYQWFNKYEKKGKPIKVELNSGDIYAMSDKAVGYDWKKSSIYTLRHAAGNNDYLKSI